MLTILTQLPSGSDIVNIASGQNYHAAGVLLLVCVYMAWAKWQSEKDLKDQINDKDKQIMEVINEHKQDIRDANNDYKVMLDKYNNFVIQIKSIVNGKS